MEQTFSAFIEKERERLAKQREDALARQKQLEQELAEIDQELNAIAAYEAAKRGTPARAPRQRRGSRQTVLDEVKKYPEGITRGQLIEAMGIQDKRGAQFISNALSHFKRQGQLRLENGRYTAD